MLTVHDAKTLTLNTGATTVSVHYYDVGPADGEPIILMHTGGAGVSAYMCWYANFDSLANAGYHVLAPDMPAFGRTQPWPKDAGHDFLTAFMDALGIRRAHLIGNSAGAMACFWFASRNPQRVRTLTMSGGEPRADTPDARPITPTLGETPRNNFVREMFAKPTLTLADVRHATADFFYDREHPAVEEAARVRMQTLSEPEALRHAKANALGQPSRRRQAAPPLPFADLQVPTFMLHGRDEPWFYPDEIRLPLTRAAVEAALLIPDCTLTLLPHCGHWPQLEQTEAYNSPVLGFLARHGGA